ncbi:nitronate monooxygenase [Streptomonospora nanhaiensis]|uniref:nitronate monooxygenase n=1 Tax=Streptomonospora nanhaiensis TaxID=1323731 RepID=UPI001C38AEF7|nr:nitronate monooxygenase [Streptomonospora nanhaiensis]MBV2364599.1 nitronate monooxygenase [Streptomonospora nanhaiensis]
MWDSLDVPVVAAPMAGGASTPELVAAVNSAGGLGFLAGGYLPVAALTEQIARVRTLTDRPFGVNLFVPDADTADPSAIDAYRQRLRAEAERLGVEPGEPRWDDDEYPVKLAALFANPVPVVSFTFGCPAPADIATLHRAGSHVVVTVTTVEEAREAVDAGADTLCVQGAEAGGHQGSFQDTYERTTPLSELLAEVRRAVGVPLIAAGGLSDGAAVRRVLCGGAAAAQLGTAFLRTTESGASQTHKDALADPRFTRTAVTRAFSGRRARGLVNRFLTEHDGIAPSGYPRVHHMTAPIRAAAARAGDAGTLHLWAGACYAGAADRPAAEVVAGLAERL